MTLWDTRPMSHQPLDLAKTWTEAEYLALGETDVRDELIDWKIVVSPTPNRPHQTISFNLMCALRPGARAVGLSSFEAIDVRLRPGTIVAPDIVIGKLDVTRGIADAADVIMAVEVTSPGNKATDRGPKKARYAGAGIPWYLIAEPDMSDYQSVCLQLFRLDGGRFVEHAVAGHGQTLISTEPFAIAIDTSELLNA
jgi:Uma2 family endonuclease